MYKYQTDLIAIFSVSNYKHDTTSEFTTFVFKFSSSVYENFINSVNLFENSCITSDNPVLNVFEFFGNNKIPIFSPPFSIRRFLSLFFLTQQNLVIWSIYSQL